MKRFLLAIIVLSTSACWAQSLFTTVTATPVLDPNNIVYVNGTYNINYVPAPAGLNKAGNYAIAPSTVTGTLDSFGNMSVQLVDNSQVSPVGSQWRFSICSSSGVTCFSTNITISGANQDITATLKAAAARLPVTGTFGLTPFLGTPNYTGTGANTLLQASLGTAGTPDSTQDSVAIFSKSGNNTTASGKNPTVYAGAIKRATCNNCGETGLFAEGNDVIGGSGSYIEGLRGHGLLNGGTAGNATGVVGLAGTGTSIPYQYLNGIEGQNYNNSGTDATTSFSSAKFAAGFLASSFGTNKVDAGFMTNPFSTAPDITGFFVPAASVSDTAFRSDAALVHGVDLSRGICSSDCFKSPGYTVDGSGNVKTAGTVQNNAGTATMGITLKTGSGSGSYSSASTTYVRVDSTNLAFTVTIPTGWKLGIAASGSSTVLTASVPYDIALADGSADNTGILAETLLQPNAAFPTSFSLYYVVIGDGASHTINLQYHTTNAADSVQIYNSNATQKPTMVMTLMPSN